MNLYCQECGSKNVYCGAENKPIECEGCGNFFVTVKVSIGKKNKKEVVANTELDIFSVSDLVDLVEISNIEEPNQPRSRKRAPRQKKK